MKAGSGSPRTFEISKGRAYEFVKKTKARRVLVEAPPGLVKYAKELCEELEAECYVSATPVFGSCLIYEFQPVDAIIHLGHNPYPWWKPSKPVLFLEAPSPVEPELEGLEKELEGRNVVLAASVQHLHLLPTIKKYLEGKGFKVFTFKSKGLEEGQVLGCDYRNLRKGFDDYLIVAGGRFHSLGAALYLQRPVLSLDPYSSRRERVDPLKILSKRMWLVSKASEAEEVAIIDGVEGQSREPLLKALKAMAEEKGKRVTLYKSVILTKEYIMNLPEEVIVIASCPRLALDDSPEGPKVVLAPGEFRAALKGLGAYSFPF